MVIRIVGVSYDLFPIKIDSLAHSDAIWHHAIWHHYGPMNQSWHISGWTLIQAMAGCYQATSHHLNQFLLGMLGIRVQFHWNIILVKEIIFEKYISKFILISHRGQRVNRVSNKHLWSDLNITWLNQCCRKCKILGRTTDHLWLMVEW